jgi:hypothetical protein
MSVLKRGLLGVVFVAQLIASTLFGWAQTPQSLQNRIPKPDPKKYHAVQDAKDWKNPYLIVRRDGVEIVGMTPVGQAPSLSIQFQEYCRGYRTQHGHTAWSWQFRTSD